MCWLIYVKQWVLWIAVEAEKKVNVDSSDSKKPPESYEDTLDLSIGTNLFDDDYWFSKATYIDKKSFKIQRNIPENDLLWWYFNI